MLTRQSVIVLIHLGVGNKLSRGPQILMICNIAGLYGTEDDVSKILAHPEADRSGPA
jgi:hypothetical protein